MTHDYIVSGMTCSGCQRKVEELLSGVPGVSRVSVNLASGTVGITMERHLPTTEFQRALAPYPRYALSEQMKTAAPETTQETPPAWTTYRPIILIFAFITGIAAVTSLGAGGGFSWMLAMNRFMAGFFLAFSFFKFLDLRGFADSYATYDVIARRWHGWGLVYPFAELALGLAYVTLFAPLATNVFTLLLMGVSLIGVVQSLLAKRKIRCACLGAVFNLPMSTVTLLEDGLMIAMSVGMIAVIL